MGVHQREVWRALASAVPPERKRPERERPKLAPALPFIDAILEADRRAPRKQRHTARRIWTRLRREKPEIVVGESTVREYVRQRKQAMGLLGMRSLSRSPTILATKRRWTGTRPKRVLGEEQMCAV